MRRISALLYLASLLPVCAGLASCAGEPGLPGGGDGETEIFEQDFSFGTRIGPDGSPQHGDAYTLISYHVGGTTSTATYKNQISDSRQIGYYAYDDGTNSERPAGTLVPVTIKFPNDSDKPPFTNNPFYVPSLGIAPLVIERINAAQRLQAVPVSGLNPANNTGLYRTAVIYPAIPIYATNTASLGMLAVYHIDTDIWASSPDDADGDPGTVDPFEFTVETNREIHPLPERTELFHIKSAIQVSFYSEYFADNDPEMQNPKTQAFDIASLKLVNVGSNGWYNARTGIVYPNYNYGTSPVDGNYAGGNWRTSYSFNEMGVNPDGSPIYPARGAYNYLDMLDPDHDGSQDDSLVIDESGNDRLPPDRQGFPPPQNYIQWSVSADVFPSDYRGGENGGLTQVKPLSLRMELRMGSAKAPLKATVPIALLMERGKRYNFYVNVMSEMISISYNVSPWDSSSESGDIGGDMIDYLNIDIEHRPGGWVVVDSGTDDIGGGTGDPGDGNGDAEG